MYLILMLHKITYQVKFSLLVIKDLLHDVICLDGVVDLNCVFGYLDGVLDLLDGVLNPLCRVFG